LQNDFDHFTIKYNKKHTAASHKITGTPPPMDISVPAKKKLPMSYILGAAAVFLVVVAGYFYMKPPNDTETPKVVNTEPKKIENPKVEDTNGLDQFEDEAGEPKPVTKPKEEVNEKTPLQKAEEAVTEAEEALEDLRGKYGVKGDPTKDCSRCSDEPNAVQNCKEAIETAKSNVNEAKRKRDRIKNPKKK
jgi:hypothetical protein